MKHDIITLNQDFDAAVTRVIAALADQGFGVITRIDMDETFREKLGVAFPRYSILGACNPALAHKAVSAEPEIGLMLPCNITVEAGKSGTLVRIPDARELLGTSIEALNAETSAIMELHNVDPNRKEQEQLAKIEQQLEQADEQIGKMITGLIEPGQMAVILEQVLQDQSGLEFVSMENLGREALVDVRTDQAGPNAPGIFKHTMRLELEGSFKQTLNYLRALETLPWQFRWDEVTISMLEYPRANIVIKVHTLSLQEGWIGV